MHFIRRIFRNCWHLPISFTSFFSRFHSLALTFYSFEKHQNICDAAFDWRKLRWDFPTSHYTSEVYVNSENKYLIFFLLFLIAINADHERLNVVIKWRIFLALIFYAMQSEALYFMLIGELNFSNRKLTGKWSSNFIDKTIFFIDKIFPTCLLLFPY